LIQSTGLVEITIENQATQVADVQQLFQLGYTTKGTNHGTGLANVKELVAKQANLFFETQIKAQRLRQTLMVTEEN
jgi:two-component system sensor histidine kinase AgrC